MTTTTKKTKEIKVLVTDTGEQFFRIIEDMEISEYIKDWGLNEVDHKEELDFLRMVKGLYKNKTLVLGDMFPITNDVEVLIARDYIREFQKKHPEHKFVYNTYIEEPKDAPETIIPLFSKIPIKGFHVDNEIKDLNDIHAPLIWNETRKGTVFISKFVWPNGSEALDVNLTIKIEKKKQGVYGIGEAFILSVRRNKELDEKFIAAFYTKSDNHDTLKDRSVDGKLWVDYKDSEDINGIQYRAEKLLRDENYI